jgi:hypothetical protein
MADDSQPIKYVYVDSTNRDTALYPSGNSYTLHLTAPLHSVVQVDLVAAKVPNSMYNLTSGSNALTFNGSNVSIAPGYYSSYGLATALVNSAGGTLFGLSFLANEGRFLFTSSVSFNVQANTTEMQRLLGVSSGSHASFAASSDPIFASDPTYTGKWLYKSTTLADMATNEYVFLDIDELRTTSVIDAKKLVGASGTTEGSTIRNTFGMIPMDVNSGCIKNYKETTDYKQWIQYTTPIPKIYRLTVRWTDSKGQLLNFQGFDNNAFTLRFHCEYQKVPEPVPPLQDVEIRRIVEAMTIAPPPPEKPKRFKIPWTLILLIILGSVIVYKNWTPTPMAAPASQPVKFTPA